MKSLRAGALPVVALALGLGAATQAAGQQQLNVICSTQGEWCNAVATEFQRDTGIRVAITPNRTKWNTSVAMTWIGMPKTPWSRR